MTSGENEINPPPFPSQPLKAMYQATHSPPAVRRSTRRFDRLAVALWSLTFLMLLGGCRAWSGEEKSGNNPMRPTVSSADGTVLEVFSVRFSLDDAEINGPLWDEIDEQHLSNARRRELERHGFRVGLVSGDIPDSLVRLLELTDAPRNRDDAWQSLDVRTDPVVNRQIIHVPKESEARIQPTSTVHEEAYVMQVQAGSLGGQTFRSAQGVLSVRADSKTEDAVLIEIKPELHYGQPKQTYSFQNGIGRPGFERPKHGFDNLKIKTALSPGQALVLTLRPENSGGLARYFFREDKPPGPEQKMVVLRLAQAPAVDLYDEPSGMP